jgi:hypothetical protein
MCRLHQCPISYWVHCPVIWYLLIQPVKKYNYVQITSLSMKWHTGVKINIRLNVSSDDSFTGEHNNTVEEVICLSFFTITFHISIFYETTVSIGTKLGKKCLLWCRYKKKTINLDIQYECSIRHRNPNPILYLLNICLQTK